MPRPFGFQTIRPLLRQTARPLPRRINARFESNVRVQKVHVRQRLFSRKRVGFFFLYTAGTYYALNWWLDTALGPLEEELEEEEDEEGVQTVKARSQEDDEEEFDEEDGIFIPLTWPKLRPREYYKGSDPEWQEFKTYNPKKIQELQKQLVSIVRNHVAKMSPPLPHVGKVDPQRGQYLLETQFPSGPPPDYERDGIEFLFAEDTIGIRWKTETLSQVDQRRLVRTVFPTSAFAATFAVGAGITKSVWIRIKSAFGEAPPQPQPNSIFDNLARASRDLQSAQKGPPNPSDQGGNSQQPQGSSGMAPPPASAPGFGSPPGPKANANPQITQLSPAGSLFKQSWMKGTMRQTLDPPRGTFIMKGLIQVVGNTGKMTFNVTAVYDPKQKRFTMINQQIQTHQRHRQRPLGGR